jgi:hypothetical protein
MDGSNEISPTTVAVELTKNQTKRAKFNTLTDREKRLLQLFLDKPLGVTRKEAEPIVGTTYAPNVVKSIRDNLGLTIHCPLISTSDRDGNKCTYGVYSLASESRAKALALLGGGNG